MPTKTLGTLGIELEAELDQLDKSLNSVKNKVKNFGKESDKAGKGLSNLEDKGKKASGVINTLNKTLKRGAVALGGFFAISRISGYLISAKDSALVFDRAFAGVIKTVDATDERLSELRKNLKKLAPELGISSTELARIAELGGQLGIATKNIEGFVETTARIAEVTNLSADQAATSFARIANITGLPQEKIENLASSVVDLGNNMATTESEIVTFATRIAASGKIAGLTDAQIVGIGAAFSSVGIQAEVGGTAVQKALLKINESVNTGNKDLEKFAKLSGLTSKQFVELWEKDAGKAFAGFVEGLGNAGDDAGIILGDLIGEDVRLQRAFLSLSGAGDLLTNSIDRSSLAFEKGTAVTEEYSKFLGTASGKTAQLTEENNELKNSIGEKLLPVWLSINKAFLKTIDFISLIAEGFSELGKAMDDFGDIVVHLSRFGVGLFDKTKAIKNLSSETKGLSKSFSGANKDFLKFQNTLDFQKIQKKASKASKEIQKEFKKISASDLGIFNLDNKSLVGKGKSKAEIEQERIANVSRDAFNFIQKTRKENVSSIENQESKWVRSLQKIQDEIIRLEETHERSIDNVKKDLFELGDELVDIENDYNKISEASRNTFGEDLANDLINYNKDIEDSKERIKEINKEIRELREEQGASADFDIQKKINKLKEEQNSLLEDQKDIEINIAKIKDTVDPKKIAEAERSAGLTETERKIEAFKAEETARKEAFENEKEILEERKIILEAFRDGELASIENIKNLENQREFDKLLIENIKNLEDQKELDKLLKEQENFENKLDRLRLLKEGTEQIEKDSLARLEAETKKTTDELITQWNAVRKARESAQGAVTAKITAQGFATGGLVGGSERTIKVNEKGQEFVMNAEATKKYLPLLENMNSSNLASNTMSKTINDNRKFSVPVSHNIDENSLVRRLDWASRFR